MKKVGIITHYYQSVNYGGVLQAFALCYILNKYGIKAEQICYDKFSHKNLRERLHTLGHNFKSMIKKSQHRSAYCDIAKRKEAFKNFRENVIPHSKIVYNLDSLNVLAESYDTFVTGSDQVWHPQAVCDAYLLNLPKRGLIKVSYAASVAKNELTEQEKKRYKNALSDFTAISVREKSAVDLIQPLTNIPVKWVVDPVFLLQKKDWEKIIASDIEEKQYIFCYFLGSNDKVRKVAEEFALRKHLKVITIPYLEGNYRKCDEKFGEKWNDVTPPQLLSLITNAEYVFTDSFHVMAFSIIFHKEFFVFERHTVNTMSSRIDSLADIFGLKSHFCKEEGKINANFLQQIKPIDYDANFDKFENMRRESLDFIVGNIVKNNLGN